MISSKKLQKVKNLIVQSRARLLQKDPVLGLLLMYLRFVADEEVKTASVNETCLFFNVDFFLKLHASEMDFALCHLLMHVLSEDIWRSKDFKGDSYHHACDIVNNALLQETGLAQERYGHLGKVFSRFGMEGVSGSGYTPLQVYSTFLFNIENLDERDRRHFLFDSDDKWDKSWEQGQNGVIVLEAEDFYCSEKKKFVSAEGNGSDGDEEGKGESENERNKAGEQKRKKKEPQKENTREKWGIKKAAVLKTAKENNWKGVGATALEKQLSLGKLQKSQVGWKKILNDFLREEINDYSFLPPDKRFGEFDFFLPDFNEKDFLAKDILFMVDTSGSIDRHELTLAYSEMKGAIEQFGGKLTGKVGFFDVEVHKVKEFTSVQDILIEIPLGGGGTSFAAIFEYLAGHYAQTPPSCVVIFTDGEAVYPEEKAAMGVPVLWLINNEEITPPWGRIVRVIKNG